MSHLSTINACKLLLFRRCLQAVLLTVGIQFLLLTIFLLFVNFQLLRPLHWISVTLSLVCSMYTWFASIPLVGAVVLYGMILCQQHLAERLYCPTRFRWLVHYAPRKLLFLAAHLLVGYLTAWLYTGYMHTDYRHLWYKCYDQECISAYHVYLLGMGIFAGCYYFVSVHMRQEVEIEFPIVNHLWGEKLREVLYSSLARSLIKSLLPTLAYTLLFWLFGGVVCHKLSHIFAVDLDERLEGFFGVATNGRLLFYGWLLTSQILSNMHLMRCFYSMFLSEEFPLAITKNRAAFVQEKEVTVVAALGLSNVYVVQCLAAKYLYNLVTAGDAEKRSELFQLTEPGNRPANWRSLCDQCLSLFGNFTDELIDSMQKISVLKGSPSSPPLTPISENASASLMAERVLTRQYNQMHGIRAIVSPRSNAVIDRPVDRIHRVPDWCERTSMQLEQSLQLLINRIPGIVYMFTEPEGAKTAFLLTHSLPLVFVIQALSQICVFSLKEDRYGVVQTDLPDIIRSMSRLKGELDKLSSVASNLRGPGSSFSVLRGAVRRSLFHICVAFGEYLSELIPSGEELHQLQTVINQE
ncbi:nucleoporin Ndc1 [Drosophila pseudoobscura]|uniref:Nucleoporin Ndc1 n=2 Tax=Drosophila pseudoobscura pseudoobscura TaxID=46245 RepID=NDC1_DROPS|nr:nucleoporin Ndc1 [Drosophila pseudoobscura]Q298S5.1 RecName: Full=Nucleoporin Ndc1 [Drosophila pseudoobscura pseudoobscura]